MFLHHRFTSSAFPKAELFFVCFLQSIDENNTTEQP
ncbi:hypothetical protein F896_00412 [Acinetobacter genomosp. 15BJ]|uniref:Uncharacterized protein n=1 Tax=Acinetobacter genomosp. 15BJ TaxID=106651 RepID=R9B723_9GAMM|nr:hypothetical protein F896_00412 [Acinetobacter genomosp. 15BJ]